MENSIPLVERQYEDDGGDIPPITSGAALLHVFQEETKRLWYLAGPAIFTATCQYSLGAITQTFAGHVGPLDLPAFAVQNNVIAGFSYGIMLGMGSALETLCGQAYGAGEIEMLGVYLQRSWIILLTTAIPLTFVYAFAEPLLLFLGQNPEISREAAQLARWMIPQLYAYALNFPIAKFLQAQSRIMEMAWISAIVLLLHSFFTWLVIMKLGLGMVAGVVVLDLSWWLIIAAQMVYIVSGPCGTAWSGLSSKAFQNLWGFVRLSLASAVMMCLEVWYFDIILLFVGNLKNAKVAVAALSVCINLLAWVGMTGLGFNAAISVRVSNELGARCPRKAKVSVVVTVLYALLISIVISAVILIFWKQYPNLFAETWEVIQTVYDLTPLLVICIVINSVQPALSGVAIGAGWQALVAYVNVGCYYIFGIPLGLLLGFKFSMGVNGVWIGMISGTVVQTLCLFWMIYKTNWNTEALVATQRIKKWGGHTNYQALEN